MAFSQEFLDDIARGKDYFSNINAETIRKMKGGCIGCEVKNYSCLKRILRALDYKVELNQNDSIADKLHDKLITIIGDYVIQIPPTVSAGVDKSVPINLPATFTAVITEGSAPIKSIQWTQTGGTSLVLNGANTATLSVSNFSTSNYTFKVTATDENGLKASDTVTLTGTGQQAIAYWGTKASTGVLTYNQIVAGTPQAFLSGQDITIPFYNNAPLVLWFAYESNEPVKNTYTDVTDPNNNGSMLNESDLFSAPTLVAGTKIYRYHETNYPTIYSPVNSVRGFTFKTE